MSDRFLDLDPLENDVAGMSLEENMLTVMELNSHGATPPRPAK
jgi:hypothetical protein